MSPPAKPLSDAISQLRGDSSSEAFRFFVGTFRQSILGVVATALPPDRKAGETFRAGAGDVELVVVATPDGRRMLKACADPDAFVIRFPETKINALMSGEQILDMLAKAPDLAGVLVCSASSLHSAPITLADAQDTLAASSNSKSRWWEFWKR
jgi:hypothetical protein